MSMATLPAFIALAAFISFTSAFQSYRIEGINPTCEPISASMCMPMKKVIAISSGRSRRSLLKYPEAETLDRVRRKRRTRDPQTLTTEWRYNFTTFPNFANDETPDDVMDSLRHLHPMVATRCSKFVNMFLCSVYSPVCTEFGVVPPCKELCERVMDDCAEAIQVFGIEWPDSVRCSLFPSYDAPDDVTNEIAFMRGYVGLDSDGIMIQRMASLTWMEALAADGKICIPPVDDDVIGPQLDLLAKNLDRRPTRKNATDAQRTQANHQYGLWCPAEMRSPPGQEGYSFLGMQNCSPPCPNMYLSEGELSGIRYVIVVLSTLCVIVTFFTLCTFLIDAKRFRYPERPIVFYAFSYFVVSLVFLIGFALKENAACNEEIRDVQTHAILQGFTVVKGVHKRACTLIFMLLYYFTVNGTIWWLILTVTWLLAAGFKWGTEAIEKYSMYYHAIAWGVPAVQTMSVVTFSKIEGDNIAGVCFLGLYNSDGLRYMLLTPLCVYLFVGITILCLGFCCLNRVRIKLRDDEVNKKKLAKFMLRIGVFSVLYIVPQIILLVVYVIEDSYRTQWEASWFLKACEYYRVPCPADGSNVTIYAAGGSHEPHVMLFCLKYILTLVVALPPLFWVASKKTMLSWKKLFDRRNITLQPRTIAVNRNSGDSRVRTASRKALLREEWNATSSISRPPFASVASAKEIHGSSASVAAQTKAKDERDSRQSEVHQRGEPESKPNLPEPPPPPAESQPSVRRKTELKKQFPDKRLYRGAASSTSTSSRVTPQLHPASSSMSSLTSDKTRRKHKGGSKHRTSSLNRTEFKGRLARDVSKTPQPHSMSELMSLATTSSSKTNLAAGHPRGPPPPKPQRTASVTSSRSNVASSSAVAEKKSTVVAALPETIGERTVEV